MLHNVWEYCVRILEEEKHRQLRMFIILWKKWKKLASSSIHQSVKSQKQCVHPRILLLWLCAVWNWVWSAININSPSFSSIEHLFRWSSFWSWRVCKQAKLGHRKPERIHSPKTSLFLVRILVQRHNWAIFLRKWVRRGRYSQRRLLSSHVELQNWRGGYWQHLVSIGRHYVPHSRSWCRLATSEQWFDTVGLLFMGCRQR